MLEMVLDVVTAAYDGDLDAYFAVLDEQGDETVAGKLACATWEWARAKRSGGTPMNRALAHVCLLACGG